MPSNFCELWWQIEDQLGVYRVLKPGLAYLALPEAGKAAILSDLQRVCQQLGEPELFGPSDAELRPEPVHEYFASAWPDLSSLDSAGLRIPIIQQDCLRYADERGEISPEWQGEPPRSPVNSVNTLTAFLQSRWSERLLHYNSGDIGADQLIESMSRVIQNVRSTIAWFHARGILPELSVLAILPQSVPQLQKYVQAIDKWLMRHAELEPLPSSAIKPEVPPVSSDEEPASAIPNPPTVPIPPSYLDLVVDREARTIRRKGARYESNLVNMSKANSLWALFDALYAKKGAKLTTAELKSCPGSSEAPARRRLKARLNEELRNLDVTVPEADWKLVDTRRNRDVRPAE